LGLSGSSVRFPSGQIASNQLGLTIAWRNEFDYLTGANGSPISIPSQATGLGFDRMSITASTYSLTDGSGRRIGLAGAQAERHTDINGFTWGMEAAAAARGNAAGYMELLGTAALSAALMPATLPSWRAGVRLGAGFAGGGAVPTGGGLIYKVSGTMEFSPWPGWTLGGEYGLVRSAGAGLRARQARVSLGIDLEPGLSGLGTSTSHVVRTEWVAALQHHVRVERRDGTRRPLDTVGLELNRYLDDHFYVSGQAHSAYAGGAGAYSIGLFGLGAATSIQTPLRVGGEVLVGAAGGGGVKASGGAIAKGVLWSAWNPSAKSEWRAGIGAMRGLGGTGQTNPVIELSWSRGFGMAGP
jgi:hypothetical protein